MKNIYLILILFAGITGTLMAGTTPGQETSRKRLFQKTPVTGESMTQVEAPAFASPVQESKTPEHIQRNTAPVSASASASAASEKNKDQVLAGKNRTGGKLGQILSAISLKNMIHSGKSLKSHSKITFLRISVTIFLFLLFLFLIAMLLGVLLNDLYVLFYIAMVLILLWILIFLLGNLGIKKR